VSIQDLSVMIKEISSVILISILYLQDNKHKFLPILSIIPHSLANLESVGRKDVKTRIKIISLLLNSSVRMTLKNLLILHHFKAHLNLISLFLW